MDELERRVAERLSMRADDAAPPPGLGRRIVSHVAARRRRRHTVAGAAALATVVALGVPTGFALLKDSPPSDSGTQPSTPTSTPTASPDPLNAPKAPPALDRLVNREAARTTLVQQPGGLLFSAQALGPSGAVLGGNSSGGSAHLQYDQRVWLAHPRDGRHVPLTGEGVFGYSHVAGDRIFAWVEYRDNQDDFELICVDLNKARARVPNITDSGQPPAVHIDRDVIVWADDAFRIWVLRGCQGTRQLVAASGPVVAFAYPHAFVFDDSTKHLRTVDVETGAISPVARLTGKSWGEDWPLFAANDTTVAWAVNRRLTLLDRRTGRTRQVPGKLPVSGEFQDVTDLTMGERLVVSSSRVVSSSEPGSEHRATALVYDLRTGATVTLNSDAFTAGRLLLWREGRNYIIAPVRP